MTTSKAPAPKTTPPEVLSETQINLISQDSKLEGKIHFDSTTRVHGVIHGTIISPAGSTLILAESSVIEGEIQADTLLISGFVKGKIKATTKVVLSSSARILGTITAPSVSVEFGAHFEGKLSSSPPPSKA